MKRLSTFCALSLLLTIVFALSALAQITPSDDAYVNSAAPTANYGAVTTLSLSSAADSGFIRFDLTAVPAGYTGSSVAKATLKLYVNSVTTAGSFNVDYVTGTWAKQTIKYSLQPAIGTTIAASVPLTTASKGKYVEIDLTAAMVEWLNGTQANDGIALVANSPLVATFDSKENTAASHPPELDLVYASIAGLTTGSGSGLTGGGTSGTLNLSLVTSCAANQVLQWNGTAWVGANLKDSGTITGVTAGTDLTGGGTSGTVKLNLDTTKIPQLATANTFVGNQSVVGTLNVASSAYQPVTVQSSNSFGTWLALGNTSSGGHTWNIISAGGGNSEGAGILGITDLTGSSTIWLEGNANVSGTLSATNVSISGTLQTASVGGSIVDADISGTNNGTPTQEFSLEEPLGAKRLHRTVSPGSTGMAWTSIPTPRLESQSLTTVWSVSGQPILSINWRSILPPTDTPRFSRKGVRRRTVRARTAATGSTPMAIAAISHPVPAMAAMEFLAGGVVVDTLTALVVSSMVGVIPQVATESRLSPAPAPSLDIFWETSTSAATSPRWAAHSRLTIHSILPISISITPSSNRPT